MKTNYPEKKISKTAWLNNDTKNTLMLAKKLKFEQAVSDLIYSAQDRLEMPLFEIRESIVNAVQDVEIKRFESSQIKKTLS